MNPHDLKVTYKQFSESELLEAYSNLDDYTPEAKTALNEEIERRGGIDLLFDKEKSSINFRLETEKIKLEVRRLHAPEVEQGFLNRMIKISIDCKV